MSEQCVFVSVQTTPVLYVCKIHGVCYLSWTTDIENAFVCDVEKGRKLHKTLVDMSDVPIILQPVETTDWERKDAETS